ncbi:MAG: cytochrome c3 family protein [bacterium]|nr:cytochrome c3 family protein [bacterium]
MFLFFTALFLCPPSMAEELAPVAGSSLAEESMPVGGEPIIEVFYPAPDSLFKNELAHLVAKISENGAAYVVVRVNEQMTPAIDLTDEAYREILGDTLITRLYLLPGENELELSVKDKDGKILESRKMKLYYRDSFSNDTSSVPETYVIRPMHTPDSGEYCKGCHRMDVDPLLDIEPEKKHDLFCVRCHEPGLLSGNPHGTATWRCLACHKTGGDPLYGVKDTEGKFCVDCHSEEVESFKGMKSVHGAVKNLKCRNCHRMHNTQETGLIPVSVNKLCYDCHDKVYDGKHITPGHPLEAEKDPSREGRGFDCTSCHNPHASAIIALLKYEPGMMMCKVCHSK